MKKHLVIHFARFGPYHFTRLRSAMDVLGPHGWRVSGLQTAGTDSTYAWDQTGLDSAGLVTVFPNRVYEEVPAGDLREGMMSMLDELKPDGVAIAGWGTSDARAALDWCGKNGAKAIVMSETRASDGNRRWWKEWLKGRLVCRFDGALVGGRAHKEYLQQLGMPGDKIRIGYDVVDNEHFARESMDWRTKEQPEPYFLASSRFIERKNLRRLVDAYAEYRRSCLDSSHGCLGAISQSLGSRHTSPPIWDLVLLGTGDRREDLELYVQEKGIEGVVFAGFQQIDALPRWYAGAGAFVHPALEEPWGLVINEAMASGLPIICSRTTGAAELVEEGGNGFLFDPRDVAALTALLERVAGSTSEEREQWAKRSLLLVNDRAPARAFGQGLLTLLSAS